MVPGPVVAPTPRNLLEMKILETHPRSPGTEVLRVGASDPCFNRPPGDSDVYGGCRTF